MSLNDAWNVLEEYYKELDDCYKDGNYEGFNVFRQYTRKKLEKILLNRNNISQKDEEFLKELIEDEYNLELIEAVKIILEK